MTVSPVQYFAAFEDHACHRIPRAPQGLHPAVQPYLHAAALHHAGEGARHVAGLLCLRINPLTPLHLHRTAVILQQRHHILRVEAAQGAI